MSRLLLPLALLLLAPQILAQTGDDLRFTSNLFTQPEPGSSRPRGASVGPGFTLAASTERLDLYVNRTDLALRIRDRANGYTWASDPSGLGARALTGLNATWRTITGSAVTLQYAEPNERLGTESLVAGPGTVLYTPRTDGFEAALAFPVSGIRLTLRVALEDDGLIVRIPDAGIQEGERRLVDVLVYPFLGATHRGDTPGYTFIPDGCGALMRYRDPTGLPEAAYSAPVYGLDPMIDIDPEPEGLVRDARLVSIPVWGMVHGAGWAGYVAAVEGGAEYARIEATPAGVTTALNWATARIVYRKQYFQPTSRTLGGITTFRRERSRPDAAVRYMFLAGDDADYVGMARRYQWQLIRRGLLTRRVAQTARGAPVLLEILGAESRPGVVRRRLVPMTTVDQMLAMVEELGMIENLVVSYFGQARGGYFGSSPERLPVEPQLGGDRALRQAAEHLEALGIPFLLWAGYTDAFPRRGGFSPRNQASRAASGRIWFHSTDAGDLYLLSPPRTLELAREDAATLPGYAVAGVRVYDTGWRLYGDYGKDVSRADTVHLFRETFQTLTAGGLKVLMGAPNEYLLGLADWHADLSQHSSLYAYTTDTVPFLQIVLHGYVDYFAPAANFGANPRDELLRTIEYGSYPSYYLTAQPSRRLEETPMSQLYTTWFPHWKDRILEEAEAVSRALGDLRIRTISGRSVPVPGVVAVRYDDGTVVAVNYRAAPYSGGGLTVGPRDFAVWRRGPGGNP